VIVKRVLVFQTFQKFFLSLLNPSRALIIHHSFTFSLQTQNLPFQQILFTLTLFFTHWTAFVIMGLDRTHQFILNFFFYIFVRFVRLSVSYYCTLYTPTNLRVDSYKGGLPEMAHAMSCLS